MEIHTLSNFGEKMKYLFIVFTLIWIVGCSQKNSVRINHKPTPSAWKVLQTGESMIRKKVLVRGSCWDYIDCIYTKAGCSRAQRKTVFKSRKKGPYVDVKKIRPGDWLYFINGSYHNSEHSAIFIKWVDFKSKTARMLSYQGEGKRKPARYKNYVLKKVYHIMRTKK